MLCGIRGGRKCRTLSSTLDNRGNIYCAGQGHIWIWSSMGKSLYKLKVPEKPGNCAFGGPKHETLYVTARTSLYRMETTVKGASARWAAPHTKDAPTVR